MMGLDFLGLGSKYWDVKGSLSVFPEGWGLGFFDTTFGDVRKNLKKFLDSGKVSAARVHIWWSDAHKIAPLDVLEKRLPIYERLAQEYPAVKFYVSHSCEYKESSLSAITKRVALVQKLCPSCVVVQTPMKSPVVKGVGLLEQHGTNSKPRTGGIVSTDGQNVFDIDAEKWVNQHNGSDITFLWATRFNLRENYKPPQGNPPPPERKAYPDKGYIKGVIRLGSPSGKEPVPTFPATNLKKPQLLKTCAEDPPGEGDKRANKPLAILKEKLDHIEIVTFQGESVGKLKYFGGFPPNLHRYYSGMKGSIGLYGYQISNKLKEASGSEWGYLKVGQTFYGPIHFAFRTPFFQEPK